jgi:hypothetical protein
MRASPPGRLALWLGLAGTLLAGCQNVPAGALKLPSESAEHRQLQTHRYEGVTEPRLLSAGLGVMQDLGFTLEGSESRLGVITGSKKLTSRRPLNSEEIIKDLCWTALIPYLAPFTVYGAATGVKEPQIVRISLVTQPDGGNAPLACFVRVTAQRVVYTDEQLIKVKFVEPLNDPRFYEEFFKRLSLSVFLEEGKT